VGVAVGLVQGDLADPTLGLMAEQVDAAITFTPFTETGLSVRVLSESRCYAAVASSDPLAATDAISCEDLWGRVGIRLPEGTDPVFRAHWQPKTSSDGPLVRSIDECLHAVLWQRAVAFVPEEVVRAHAMQGISYVPVYDVPTAGLALVWRRADRNPLVADYIDAVYSYSLASRAT
jgi:DNA-binding transcriptional LysR family regulator